MYHRFFVVSEGPLIEAMRSVIGQRRKSERAIRAFMKKHGVTNVCVRDAASYRFDLKEYKNYDQSKWRKTKPVRGAYYFVPRKNTPNGKVLAEEVKALPSHPSFNKALEVVPDLPVGFPCVIEGNTGYSPYIRFYSMRDPALVLVSIPWKETDEKELAAYKKQAASKKRHTWSASLDYAQWTPPDWMREIKEWEALKIIDDYDTGENGA